MSHGAPEEITTIDPCLHGCALGPIVVNTEEGAVSSDSCRYPDCREEKLTKVFREHFLFYLTCGHTHVQLRI